MLSTLVLAATLASSAQHWSAASQTAMAITGDVTFTPSLMRFSDGKSIRIARIRTTKRYDLYRVLGRANPTLLRGNTLCGPSLGYLTIARDRDGVHVAFYAASKNPPSGLDTPADAANIGTTAPSMCGTFWYVR